MTGDAQPIILIDGRAGSGDLVSYPCLAHATLTTLPFGDAMFYGNGPDGRLTIGVEVKSILDLVGSLQSGRLQATQIPGMLALYDETWLLVYGDFRPEPDKPNPALQIPRGVGWSNWSTGKRTTPYSYVASFFMTLTQCGVNVARVPATHGRDGYDKSEAAAWLATAARWWSRPWEDHASMRVFDKSQELVQTFVKKRVARGKSPNGKVRRIATIMPTLDDKTHARAQFIASIRGLSYERAVAAAKHFPTRRAMIDASVKDWLAVDGIGKVLARTIVDSWDA